ncbi:DUF1707 domain-containing protein [Actinoplanes sp. NPDC048796]|uniref:DUF1707 SHOCT-like domain-containing protein n=1 Tax=Actinoplanes sp. NPDC048796 TaxID=3155640 RepID=UPI00340E2722
MQPNDTTRRMRTSDQEREQVAEILRAAMAEGRLDLTEGEQRLAACYAATYRDELTPLTADLPGNGLWALAESPAVKKATRRGLRRHVNIVVSVAMILTGLWIISGAQFFWPAIPLAFLVMGLIRHARWGRYAYAHRIAPWNAPGYSGHPRFHSGHRGC